MPGYSCWSTGTRIWSEFGGEVSTRQTRFMTSAMVGSAISFLRTLDAAEILIELGSKFRRSLRGSKVL